MCVTLLNNIPTNCKALDKVLGGGVPSEGLSLIYGEAETGKTTLAMQCAVNCVRQGYKVLYVDCDGTFSAKRLSQIAFEDFGKLAELIMLMKPNDFSEQVIVVDQLEKYITKNVGLVVFDTMTSLYRAKIAESPKKTFELNRELNRLMASIAQISRIYKIAILITSQVRTAFSETYISIEPVATRVLKFWADAIIFMKLTENPQVIQACIEKTPKHIKLIEPLTCLLRITEKGIREYSS